MCSFSTLYLIFNFNVTSSDINVLLDDESNNFL